MRNLPVDPAMLRAAASCFTRRWYREARRLQGSASAALSASARLWRPPMAPRRWLKWDFVTSGRDLYVYIICDIYIYMCVCLKKAWSCHVCACTSHLIYNSCVYCSWKHNSEWLIFDWSNSLAPRQGPREAIAQRPHAINVCPDACWNTPTRLEDAKNVAMIILFYPYYILYI